MMGGCYGGMMMGGGSAGGSMMSEAGYRWMTGGTARRAGCAAEPCPAP